MERQTHSNANTTADPSKSARRPHANSLHVNGLAVQQRNTFASILRRLRGTDPQGEGDTEVSDNSFLRFSSV